MDVAEAFRKAIVDVLVPEIRQLREDANARFEKMDQRFEKMDQRLHNIEEGISEMRGEMRTLFPVLKTLLNERTSLVEIVTRLEDKFATII